MMREPSTGTEANTYQKLLRKALGLAFVGGPLLISIGAAIYLLGIERSLDGTSSWVEGVFMAFGFVLFVPIYFELARILGQRAPVFGIICAITGLGISFTLMPSMARIMQVEIINAGLNVSIWTLMTHPGRIPFIIGMGLGMCTSLLLGTGFLWKGGLPRWTAILLILAPILLVIGQGGDDTIARWQVTIFYPLACVTWLVALASVGLPMLRGQPANLTDARFEVLVRQ